MLLAITCGLPMRSTAAEEIVPLIVIDQVPLSDTIKNLVRQCEFTNVIFDPRVPGSSFGPGRLLPQPAVSVRLTNISAQAALREVLKQHKLKMVTNPATTVTRIAPIATMVEPVRAEEAGSKTNKVVPLLVMDEVPMLDGLNALGKEAGLYLTFDPKLQAPEFTGQGTLRLRWENITARQALAALMDNYYLTLTETGPGRAHIRFKDDVKNAP